MIIIDFRIIKILRIRMMFKFRMTLKKLKSKEDQIELFLNLVSEVPNQRRDNFWQHENITMK